MKHVFILKSGTDQQFLNQIIACMQGYQYEFRFTQNLDEAREIALEYQKQKCRLYAVGGDGFVHKVANGMAYSQNELVVIPQGTGNDFARSLYQSRDPIQILKKSLTLKAQPFHLIKCNDVYCINICCCGLDAQIANQVHLKKYPIIPRSWQYMMQILKQIITLPSYSLNITYDDLQIYRGNVTIGAFCNSQYFGGGFYIGYHTGCNQDLIDIEVVDAIYKKELPFYAYHLLRRTLHKTKKYHHYQYSHIALDIQQNVNIDGEIFGRGHYDLKMCPHALYVVSEKHINQH